MDSKKSMMDCVDELIRKAAATPHSDDAMRWTQAACNAANALSAAKLNKLREQEPQ